MTINQTDPLEHLVEVMNKCPDPQTRKSLWSIVRRLKEPVTVVELPKAAPAIKQKVTQESHNAAVKAGRKARANGESRDGYRTAGGLQERHAWLAGFNDEDTRRGGK